MKDHLEENSFILIEGLFWFYIFICWCFSKLKKKKAMMNDMAENERTTEGK